MILHALSLLIVVGSLAACSPREGARDTFAVLDDFADTVHLRATSKRIVSLSPVTTEILFAIGAGDRVVGRTHWDLYPLAAQAVTDVGNGMQPNVEVILGVHPDLVVLYASASNRAAAAQFRKAGIETLAIRTDHIADFSRAVQWLARATGDSAAGAVLTDSVERTLSAIRALPRPAKPPTVFWHIWDSPIYTVGQGSFISELVEIVGGRNVFDDLAAPSPQVTMEEIVRRNPDFVVSGPVSAPKIRASAAWHAVPAVRAGRIIVVDTALVGRPGTRLGEAARHLRALLVPDSAR